MRRRAAETIIAEIGLELSVFPSPKHRPPGPAQCPGNDQSAGKRRSGKSRQRSSWLGWALEEAALAAVRSKDVYLPARDVRLRPRRGYKEAVGAVKHSIICACWHMLATAELYRELGGDYCRTRHPQRITRRLVSQLEGLGHQLAWRSPPSPTLFSHQQGASRRARSQ